MKLNFRNISILSGASLMMMACSTNPDSPGHEYVPDMYRSQAIEAYVDYGLVKDVEHEELKNTMSARIPAEGTIPYYADKDMAEIMMPYTYENSIKGFMASMNNKIPSQYLESEDIALAHSEEGKKLYGYFCTHCHGDKGKGDGGVVTVGEFNPPAAYDEGYKTRTLGQIFHVITHGQGAMGSHASQLNKDERWKVALYVRSLQHGDIKYNELLQGRRVGEKEILFSEVDLADINKGIYVTMRKINFAVGSFDLTAQSKAELDTLAGYLAVNADVLEISGHTDNTGDEAANVVLSQDRAKAVVGYLVEKGVANSRLQAEGFGSSVPVALNSSDDGRTRNRRIEFVKI